MARGCRHALTIALCLGTLSWLAYADQVDEKVATTFHEEERTETESLPTSTVPEQKASQGNEFVSSGEDAVKNVLEQVEEDKKVLEQLQERQQRSARESRQPHSDAVQGVDLKKEGGLPNQGSSSEPAPTSREGDGLPRGSVRPPAPSSMPSSVAGDTMSQTDEIMPGAESINEPPPSREHANMEHANMEQSSREQASREQANIEQPSMEQSSREQASREQASREQASREQASREQASREQASREQASREQASIEQPSMEQPSREQPSREQASSSPKLDQVPKAAVVEKWPYTDEKVSVSDEANQLFEDGQALLNASTPSHARAYEKFVQAAELGHVEAGEHVAAAYMLGDHLPRDWAKSYEMFSTLANSHGSPRAQFYLALMYSFGIHVNASQSRALIYLTLASTAKENLARMAVGYRYLAGVAVKESCETSLAHYSTVAEEVVSRISSTSGGELVSRIRLADDAESGNQLSEDLIQFYHYRALKADVQAQMALGQLYYQGSQGVARNFKEALHFFTMAHKSGNANAGGLIGQIYAEGSEEVPQNNETALRYFEEAAKENSPPGQYGLGMFYLDGQAVTQDHQKALDHLRKAARQGWPDAQLQLGIFSFKGLGPKGTPNYAEAANYFTQASQAGHVLAYYYLARINGEGLQTVRSCPTALGLYKNVAERGAWSKNLMLAYNHYKAKRYEAALLVYMVLAEAGYEVAQNNVAYLLDKGLARFGMSTHSSYQKAILLWSRAAGQGATSARVRLGDYHYYGLGTEVNYDNAAQHYRLASEQQSSAQAMFNLGFMHENGVGMKQDLHLAKRMYDQAARTSTDASVPVGLALIKLHSKLYLEFWFPWALTAIDVEKWVKSLPDDWDISLMTVLALILGLVLLLRRANQQQERQRQAAAMQAQAAAAAQ